VRREKSIAREIVNLMNCRQDEGSENGGPGCSEKFNESRYFSRVIILSLGVLFSVVFKAQKQI
jgi:hypothetical protein